MGGSKGAKTIAEYLGVDAGAVEKRVARLLCAGGSDVSARRAPYEGAGTCRAAAVVAGGGKGCAWGCLGLADCKAVCTFDAIEMSATGIPVVDPEKCTGCEECVKICPKGLFEMAPISQRLLVQCKSELEGDQVLASCRVGCTACGRCVADASPGLLKMAKNLPVLDRAKLDLQNAKAIRRCPTGSIVWLETPQQFPHLVREKQHVV